MFGWIGAGNNGKTENDKSEDEFYNRNKFRGVPRQLVIHLF